MNKKLKMILTFVLLSGTTLYAADNIIGTRVDPVVTKSYVDMKIKEQLGKVEGQKSTFEIVDVPVGKAIYGKQGSEMIIRSGEGRIIASLAGGVQDVTDGVDLAADVLAPKNNLLIIPREDGRGIFANKTMTIMVRGGYTIL